MKLPLDLPWSSWFAVGTSPLSTNVTPLGSAPVRSIVGVG